MRRWCKWTFLLTAGGLIYGGIEVLWRGYTHWTMAVLGGICFLICGAVNEYLSWEMPLLLQCLICAVMITAVELAAGMVLNTWLGMAVWDYSRLPANFMGQICLGYSCLWYALSLPAILLDDWIRWRLFREEKPIYKLI